MTFPRPGTNAAAEMLFSTTGDITLITAAEHYVRLKGLALGQMLESKYWLVVAQKELGKRESWAGLTGRGVEVD